MAVAVTPVRAPFDYRRAWVILMLALIIGLSLAAVAEARRECRDEPLMADDGVTLLIDDGVKFLTGRQQCQLELGGLRVALPPWVNAILNAGR